MELNKIYNGESLEVLKSFPDSQVDMCITSPPYWGLRDYGVDGQLGLEKDFHDYVNRLCTIFDEVKRVLKDSGTCWVNISDSYGGSGNASGHKKDTKNLGYTTSQMGATKGHTQGLTPKSLIGIPFRFALEMINRGWILRNTIIWHKPNCMPSSVKDRFTVDFEYLFFFSKNKKYYFEQQFEPVKETSLKRYEYGLKSNWNDGVGEQSIYNNDKMKDSFKNPNQRNKRAVWYISTKPYKGAHFAVFPEDLIETPIRASCPEFICNKCGEPRIKEYEKVGEFQRRWSKNNADGSPYGKQDSMQNINQFKSYSDCGCNAGFHPGVVLDPFIGSGTTAAVSKRLNRNYVGIELNPDYLELINKRLESVQRVLI